VCSVELGAGEAHIDGCCCSRSFEGSGRKLSWASDCSKLDLPIGNQHAISLTHEQQHWVDDTSS